MTDRSLSNHLSAADDPSWARRGFLLSAAAPATVPVLIAADPAVAAEELPAFPADVALYRSAYRNWVGLLR
ncbi:hypothetical protein ACIRVK_17250 [Streptomyces sp. NPDC101152]|uniref:hypothetical protein n=1 Tax=Streptomyces sp. NPDC101152 TaxID=3366116 RepID=UPI003802823E